MRPMDRIPATDVLDTLPQRRVFVSYSEQWNLGSYLEHYLRTRRLPPTSHERRRVAECLLRYTAPTLYKADLDYFLDANLGRPA